MRVCSNNLMDTNSIRLQSKFDSFLRIQTQIPSPSSLKCPKMSIRKKNRVRKTKIGSLEKWLFLKLRVLQVRMECSLSKPRVELGFPMRTKIFEKSKFQICHSCPSLFFFLKVLRCQFWHFVGKDTLRKEEKMVGAWWNVMYDWLF